MQYERTYFTPSGLIPPQTSMVTSKVIVKDAYSIIPAVSLTDNVRSVLPGWKNTRCWVLTAPAMGHAAGFAQYVVYLDTGGGCPTPEAEPGVESFLFVLGGVLRLTLSGQKHELRAGGFAFVPAGAEWSVENVEADSAKFIWLRKFYERLDGYSPNAIVGNEAEIPVVPSAQTDQKWTTNLIPSGDVAYDMHMNIVSFGAGMNISFIEAHVMEHGLYMLQGRGLYLLNDTWHEVEAGDFIWMRAFCPQSFQASGDTPARYLLYKNVNRQLRLSPQ